MFMRKAILYGVKSSTIFIEPIEIRIFYMVIKGGGGLILQRILLYFLIKGQLQLLVSHLYCLNCILLTRQIIVQCYLTILCTFLPNYAHCLRIEEIQFSCGNCEFVKFLRSTKYMPATLKMFIEDVEQFYFHRVLNLFLYCQIYQQ